MTSDSQTQILIMNAGSQTIGIRMDHILSFLFNEPEASLSIRFIGDPTPQVFQGPLAQAIMRELRYAGRK
jgi:hypothetical protein